MVSSIVASPLIPSRRDRSEVDGCRRGDRDGVLRPEFTRSCGSGDMREAFRRLPSGVALVTGGRGERSFVATAVSVAPLSIDPPTVILCLDIVGSGRRRDFFDLRRIGVSILAAQHRDLAEFFLGSPGVADCPGGAWTSMAEGSAVVADALLAFECKVEEILERRGQAIVVAEVESMQANRAASALIYWRGEYDRIGWTEAEIACATGVRP